MSNREQTRESVLRQALETIESLQARLAQAQTAAQPIAVVGIGCRFPGANGPDAFWRLLRGGVDAIRPIPPERWEVEKYYSADADEPGKTNSRWGGFIDQVDQFDPGFFGIAPREATTLDPQQRLLLEVAWEALEHAAIAPDKIAGTRTGVFVGVTNSDYSHLLHEHGIEAIGPYHLSGSHLNFNAGRIAYCLGLNGPAVAMDTACSSSLTAVHLACQSLRAGDCEMALAGGVNLILTPEGSVTATKIKMLAGDGRCKTFDARADGFVRGEGCGIIVLKPLAAAEAAGDRIFAVIRGSALNQDGASGGLTVPNIESQKAVIRQAVERAGVDPALVSYIEAHGTGTALGDPIELRALAAVLGQNRPADRPLVVGSVKTNIGHLESAAGIAGVIKTVLALHHGQVPPHLHFEQPNPHVNWDELPISIPTALAPMPQVDGRSIAGVSAFGASGTNAHVVLESVPAFEDAADDRDAARVHFVPVSARSDAALRELAGRYRDALNESPLADVAYTAGIGRAHFNHRLALVSDSADRMRELIDEFLAGKLDSDEPPEGLFAGEVEGAAPRIGFLFTGQGSQYAGMGSHLAKHEPVFREALERCEKLLGRRLGTPLRKLLETPGELDQTALTQPALLSIQWALFEQWRAWGINPSAVLGHSLGEYAAACAAGIMPIEDALDLVIDRGRLMGSITEAGAMAAVMAGEAAVRPALFGAVSIAALNGPHQTVISGRVDAVNAALERLGAQNIEFRLLNVSLAAHSPLLDPMLGEFESIARCKSFHAPRISFGSPVLGGVVEAGTPLPPDYWRRNVRETVRFADAAMAVAQTGIRVWLEIGPTPTLCGMAQGFIDGGAWLPSLRRSREDCQQMTESLGRLYTLGCAIDWEAVSRPDRPRRVSLPTYPFERRRYWLEPVERGAREQWAMPLIRSIARSPMVEQIICESPLEALSVFVADHRIGDETVWPAAATLELALEAGGQVIGDRIELSDVMIQQSLKLDGEADRVQCILKPNGAGETEFTLISLGSDSSWHNVHATGMIRAIKQGTGPTPNRELEKSGEAWDGDLFYEKLAARGMNFGPGYRAVERVWRRLGEALARIGLNESHKKTFFFAPNLLDACLQSFAAAWLDEAGEAMYLPLGFESFVVYGLPAAPLWAHSVLRGTLDLNRETMTADITIHDDSGRLIAEVRGFSVKRISEDAMLEDCFYEMKWSEFAVTASGGTANGKNDSPWLIFTDQSGLGDQLAASFEAEGESWHLLNPETDCELTQVSGPIKGVVYLSACDALLSENDSDAQLKASARKAATAPLELMQSLASRLDKNFQGMLLVTRGAQRVHSENISIAQSLLWGFGRTVAIEHPELNARLVDLDPGDSDCVAQLMAEIRDMDAPHAGGIGSLQSAWRAGQRYCPKLEKVREKSPQLVEIANTTPGVIDGLKLIQAQRQSPLRGEVEVAVGAAGLNFRDVMIALNLLPEPAPMGVEIAGRIAAIGEGVDGLSVGDRVVGVVFGGAFRSTVIADARLVTKIPDAMSDAQAASIPSAFLTAQEALFEIGGLRAGQSVLIHAAAGGVGLAAVALAQKAGAQIFATAGSPAKRDHLHSLGVEHVFDSRSISFADDVRTATGGRGIDLVLNSLTGELMRASLELVAPSGHFLEIGKTGVYSPEQADAINHNANYHLIDLVATCRREPERIHQILSSLVERIASGEIAPIPNRVFEIEQAAEAFRFMAQAKHIGKIVLRMPARRQMKPDAAYLVTGGTGGLGLATAGWLIAQGARKIALISRRDPSADTLEKISQLEQTGARVRVYPCDVAHELDLRRAIDSIESDLGPLRGVVHAAGVIEDAVLAHQDAESFARVLAPKVEGAWNLHRLTRGMPLDFFVMYSSGASILGSAGQGAYAAACAFEDALAWHRRALGLPATSINWGPWGEVGMTANATVAERLRRDGFIPFSTSQALELLGRILDQAPAQIAAMRVNWSKYAASSGQPQAAQGPAAKISSISEELENAAPEERMQILDRLVREQVRLVLGLDADQAIAARQGFASLGMDSLMSVELRNRLQRSLGRSLPTTLTFDYPTIEEMTKYLASLWGGVGESFEAEVAGMSDEEAEALLIEELKK